MKKFREMIYCDVYEYPMEEKYVEEVCGMLDRYDITHKVGRSYYLHGFGSFRIVTVYTTGSIWLVVNKIDEKLDRLREKEDNK